MEDPDDLSDDDEPALVRSFYRLDFCIEPGGRRKWNVHLYGDLARVEAALRDDLSSDPEAALVFEEAITIRAYESGLLVATWDVRPFVTIALPGHGDVTFDANGEPAGLDALAESDDWDALAEGRVRPTAVHVDLSAALPALAGERLAPGESVEVDVGGEPTRLPYGLTMLE